MKKEKKPVSVKIHPLYRKKYTDKQFDRKILKKIHIDADRKLVESVFTVKKDAKGKSFHTCADPILHDKKQAKQLAAIAKQIKKQKGRFNIGAIAAALAGVVVLVLVLVVFRNPIARFAVTAALEGSFGAKCEIAKVDCNLLDARFSLSGLNVANRNAPMKNLFGIGNLDLHFSLLELTRGKIVAENLEITGVTWNTDRAVSGALPPKQQKKFEKKQAAAKTDNPVSRAISAEVDKLKSGISVGSGIDALKDQYDPVNMLEKEKAALRLPAVSATIKETVPALSAKWEPKAGELRASADKALADSKQISAIKPDAIKTAAEAQAALAKVKEALDSSKKALELTKGTADEAGADTKSVAALTKEAEAAYAADSARLKELAASVKSVNLDTGKQMISGVFNTFAINTLGAYYPYLQQGMAALKRIQSSSAGKEKTVSLKKKAGAVARLPGRDYVFGDNSMPRVYLKRISLSASDAASGISGSGLIEGISSDADRVGKPVVASFNAAQGALSASLAGTVDLRSAAAELMNGSFTVDGYSLDLPSPNASSVPTIRGTLGAKGTLQIATDGAVDIGSLIKVSGAKASVAAFEPAILYSAYRDALAGISTIDVSADALVSADGKLTLKVDSGLDSVIADAMQSLVSKQTAEIKAGIQREGAAFLAKQKEEYSAEIARFTAVSAKATKAVDDIKNADKTLEAKKAELEKRIQALAAEQSAPVQKAADDAAKKAGDSLKKLF